ncbi:hypothetical protein CRYPA_376 [uncultured Candidatus Thioglobus sp.]|nr:hypothetical protein CRYPA_376 [uncultured Candidatus Thioglobus sp.]
MFNNFIGFPLMMWLFIPLIVIPFWFIFLKVGYSKWPSLNKEAVQ